MVIVEYFLFLFYPDIFIAPPPPPHHQHQHQHGSIDFYKSLSKCPFKRYENPDVSRVLPLPQWRF